MEYKCNLSNSFMDYKVTPFLSYKNHDNWNIFYI